MIAVVQRVLEASVVVDDPPHRAAIDEGLLVLLGVEEDDDEARSRWMADRIARLRIFRDSEGRMNHSVLDTGGSILLVPQFTLAGDCSRGNRPSFASAAEPETGQRLYDDVATHLRAMPGLPLEEGVFGAMMRVSLVNDGPVTIILRRP